MNTNELTLSNETLIEEVLEKIKPNVVLFGYANEQLKQWFLSKHKKTVMPKGSRLLFKILAKNSKLKIHHQGTYPMVGDIVSDIKGKIFEIIEVEWI